MKNNSRVTRPRGKRVGRAFTLIELIVVILILAILAAMIVPRYFSRVDDTKRAKARSDIAQFGKLLQVFRMDTGRYPSTEEGLQALRTQPGEVTNWRGPYLESRIPLDPWGNEYIYEYPGPGGEETVLILTYGADGAPGGEGNNEDIVEGDVEE
jgi:general secretion pathway protein G